MPPMVPAVRRCWTIERSLIRHPRFLGHDHCQRPLVSAFVQPLADDALLVERERRSQRTTARGGEFAICRSLRTRALENRHQGRIEAMDRHGATLRPLL